MFESEFVSTPELDAQMYAFAMAGLAASADPAALPGPAAAASAPTPVRTNTPVRKNTPARKKKRPRNKQKSRPHPTPPIAGPAPADAEGSADAAAPADAAADALPPTPPRKRKSRAKSKNAARVPIIASTEPISDLTAITGAEVLQVAHLRSMVAVLSGIDPNLSNTDRIDALGAIEDLKGACAAAQVNLTLAFAAQTRRDGAARGTPAAHRMRGVASQIGLARRDSPHAGGKHLGFAQILAVMPHLHRQLAAGTLTEWRAQVLAREVAVLSDDDRTRADERLCADPDTLTGLGTKKIAALAAALATEYDADAKVRRAALARSDRRVTSRPAPDAMATVTVLVPAVNAVSMIATLRRDAVAIVAAGDPEQRTRSQIEADLAFERLTGINAAMGPPVEVGLVISDRALFAGADDDSAHLRGYGPIPSALARVLISGALTPTGPGDTDAESAEITLRRIYAAPTSRALTQMESTSRLFPKCLRRLIDTRDRTCRTPWCDAPIRHLDHIAGWGRGRGGQTTGDNGDGLCAACNYAKEADGWTAHAGHGTEQRTAHEVTDIGTKARDEYNRSGAGAARHEMTVTTPTGHSYTSTAPAMPATLEHSAAENAATYIFGGTRVA